MSQSEIIRFPNHTRVSKDHNPEAADAARQRISNLPDPYLAHATPNKEKLIGLVHPVSPAAQGAQPVAAEAVGTIPQPAPALPKTEKKVADAPVATEEPKAKPKRKLPSKFKPLITGVITFVLLYLVFKAPIFISQINYLTHSKPATTTADTSSNNATAVPPAPTISIPKINVNAPVVYATNNAEAAIQKDLESGVVHYANTAIPGENGNSVIFGHSSNDWWEPGGYKFVFVLLDKLQVGDTFSVNYNSKQYIYQVYETKVVEPTDMSVTYATPDPQMTLITCTPPGTSWKRLVVRSHQISPAPGASSSATPTAQNINENSLPGNSKGISNGIGNIWQTIVDFFSGGSSNEDKNTTQSPGAGDSSSGVTLPNAK